MGRYSDPLARRFSASLPLAPDDRVLDVGCGPGALTAELAGHVRQENVSAVDPSAPFVEAVATRLPQVQVRQASAESLPFDDGEFDAAVAQLVVHFMADPVRGLGEMARVTRPGGFVAANVWDHGGGSGPLHAFWSAARAADPDAPDESELPGVREGHLVELMGRAGLASVEGGALTVEVEHDSFDQWWEPFMLGVGPAGAHLATLDDQRREQVRQRCLDELGEGPFVVRATAWTAVGRVPSGPAPTSTQ